MEAEHEWVQAAGDAIDASSAPPAPILLRGRGLLVAIVGPDGAGKSTLVASLQEEFERAGLRCQRQHVRPRLFGRRDEANDAPHAARAHGWLMSIAKLCYLALDYIVGYHAITRPALRKATLCLSDRYYEDLLVDPRRHRYAGPTWLVHALGWLVPRPDVVLVLTAPASVVLARKAEVPLHECERQLEAYRALARRRPNAWELDAASPPRELLRHACACVLVHCATLAPWMDIVNL